MAKILLIDDDHSFSSSVRAILESHGHDVEYRESTAGGLDLLSHGDYDVVLLDNRMPGLTGIEFLAALDRSGMRVPVILMTGEPTSETAIQAMNLGAFNYVVKPLELDDLITELEPIVADAEQLVKSMKEHVRLPNHSAPEDGSADDGPRLLGNSRPMQEVYKQIGRVTSTDVSVLILGETGTGKELVARAIHSNSPRQNRPFVAINCTALNENLLDSELFGYEPGAFTGAAKLRKGKFEYADGGTLFLDEVGDMPPSLQVKLLRVLENKEVVRVGGNESLHVNVRVVSATNHDLHALVQQGKFRADLLFRLNFVCISLPPLRERGEGDLRLLADHFLRQMAMSLGRSAPPTIQDATWKNLLVHSWPGNVREFQHVIGRALLRCRGSQITARDVDLAETTLEGTGSSLGTDSRDANTHILRAIRAALGSGQTSLYRQLSETMERELLRLTLVECGGNLSHTARRLGLSLNGLRSKMRSHGLK